MLCLSVCPTSYLCERNLYHVTSSDASEKWSIMTTTNLNLIWHPTFLAKGKSGCPLVKDESVPEPASLSVCLFVCDRQSDESRARAPWHPNTSWSCSNCCEIARTLLQSHPATGCVTLAQHLQHHNVVVGCF